MPGLGAFLVVTFIGTIVSTITQRLMAEDPSDIELTKGLRANTRDPSVKLPIVYGRIRIGGNDVFIEAAGTNNQDLWIVQTLSEGECDEIGPLDDESAGEDGVWLGEKLASEFGSNVVYYFHGGTSSQTFDANLNAAISKFNDNLQHTCYLVWKLVYDGDLFQNLPQRTVLLKGRKLYDFRDATTAWSDNPVLALYDFMTSERYGYGFDSSRIDTDSWVSAANYCDIKGWTINMKINRDIAGQDVLDAITTLFRGQLVWYSGKFYLRYADLTYESSVMTLNDNHIVQADDGRAEININEPGTFDIPEGLRVSFIDAEKEYVEDSIMIGDEQGVIKEMTLAGCTSRQQASDIGVYTLERIRLDRIISGTFRDDAVQLEPYDVITLNTDAFSISNQLMRVQNASVRPDGLIDLVLAYESQELYDDDYDTEIEGTYTCDLPDPYEEPPSVSDVSVAQEATNYRLRNFTRLTVSFDPPAGYPFFDYVEVWISFDDAIYTHQFNAYSDFNIENVQEGIYYWIRLKVVSIFGVKQLDINDYKIYTLVTGFTDNPPSLVGLNAVVSQNSINLYSVKLDDPDIEHYEFRTGSSWSGGIFLAALRAPNLSLTGVRPGNHTFWVNTYSNNGNYGASPQSASVTLIDPPDSWTLQNTETCDYQESGEDHSNTEHVLYSGDDYLKCSHGSAGLVGIYTSQEYDLLSSGRYMLYLLADIVVTGLGTTWSDVIPDNSVVATTWNDINISTRKWTEIFELIAAPQVKMNVLYGDASPPTNRVEQLEILSAIVTGRYFQVEIEITDPSDAVNALVENFTLKFCQ